jgi:hypothetical protein
VNMHAASSLECRRRSRRCAHCAARASLGCSNTGDVNTQSLIVSVLIICNENNDVIHIVFDGIGCIRERACLYRDPLHHLVKCDEESAGSQPAAVQG